MSGSVGKAAVNERRPFVIGNWKMNGNKKSIDTILARINGASLTGTTDVVVAPPMVYLDYVQQRMRADVKVVAQNVWTCEKGAFTGETSPHMLLDLGVQWAIVGHPERRGVHGETDSLIGEKHAFALASGLNVVAVIGDRADEEEKQDNWEKGFIGNGEEDDEKKDSSTPWSTKILFRQLQVIANNTKPDEWSRVVIAYEALWTMRDRVAASPAQAQAIHASLRGWLAEHVSAEVASQVRIVHAGFVDASNCRALIKCPDVDGFLLGGAALKPEFLDIVASASNIRKRIAFWEGLALDCSKTVAEDELARTPLSPIAA